jgi:hypothetical protein
MLPGSKISGAHSGLKTHIQETPNNKICQSKATPICYKKLHKQTKGANLSLTRLAFKTLVQPVLTYGCHVFAHKMFTDKIQSKLQQINRLAALSLGSVPRIVPTITLEVLYNLRPLDLEMEHIALKIHSRITQDPNRVHIWNSIGSNTTDGHLRHWHQKTEQYGIERQTDGNKISKTRVWISFFKVRDFESTRNDAQDKFNQFVCYTWDLQPQYSKLK